MRRILCLLTLLALPSKGFSSTSTPGEPSTNRPTVILVIGAAGEEEFGTNFLQQLQLWTQATEKAAARQLVVGSGGPGHPGATNDLESLKEFLNAEPKVSPGELWIVLIGHGTFDGKEAKFGLQGPDFTAADLAGWLKPFQRPIAVIDTSSASAPFLNLLTRSNRVVITATRSGHELSFARFGQYIAEAVTDPSGDLDQDGQTSLLEAFLAASHRVAEFYKAEGRLASEHALIDDNGDGRGTPPDWFRGVRAVKKPQDGASLDGVRAHQMHLVPGAADAALTHEARMRRDELELEIERLRSTKASLSQEEYYKRLEGLMLEVAHLYWPVQTR